jgi:Uma2 family endonuclease
MTQRAGTGLRVAAEAQLNLTDDTYVVTDVLVYPASIKSPDVRGPTALLVVEVAYSSLQFDLLTKASLYASHGVREYWMIDANTFETIVHRQPSGSKYAEQDCLTVDDRLIPELVPGLAVTLRELDLG